MIVIKPFLSLNIVMNIIEKSRKSLEFDKIAEKLSNYAKTKQSKEICLKTLPFDDIVKIKNELKCTAEAKYILDIPNDIPIEFVADIQQIQKNMGATYLSEEELIDVAKTLKTSRLVKKFLSENLPMLSIIRNAAQNLITDKQLEDKIFATFDENLNIRQDATPELKGLFAALRDNEKNLKNTVNSLLNSADFSKHLQENIYTTRDDRIVFQVMASSKSKVPGIVHDVSATNKTFYIENPLPKWGEGFLLSVMLPYASCQPLHTSIQALAFENANRSSQVSSIAELELPAAGNTVSNRLSDTSR